MSHEPFYRCPCYVPGPGNITVVLLSMEGQRSSRITLKIILICVPKINGGLRGLE